MLASNERRIAPSNFCKCGRHMASWRSECARCSRARSERLQAQTESDRLFVNKAIHEGAPIRNRAPNTHDYMQLVKYLYEGVPGIWEVLASASGHNNEAHYCLGGVPADYVNQAEEWHTTGWINNKHYLGCMVTTVCTCTPTERTTNA